MMYDDIALCHARRGHKNALEQSAKMLTDYHLKHTFCACVGDCIYQSIRETGRHTVYAAIKTNRYSHLLNMAGY